MFTRILTAAGLAVMFAQASAGAAEITPDGKDKAAEACQGINAYGPVSLAATVEDGMGDWLVWVKDKDGDLWMCNANSQGAVYTNFVMQGDLIDGAGKDLVGLQNVADRSGSAKPAETAEALCAAVGSKIEEMKVVVTVADGLGDYVTWLKNGNDELWLCNASGEAKLYDFEPVDLPLNDVKPAELRTA
jgi:hypothetical protein